MRIRTAEMFHLDNNFTNPTLNTSDKHEFIGGVKSWVSATFLRHIKSSLTQLLTAPVVLLDFAEEEPPAHEPRCYPESKETPAKEEQGAPSSKEIQYL